MFFIKGHVNVVYVFLNMRMDFEQLETSLLIASYELNRRMFY